mgnify:CR=1 FL=1
MPNSPSEKQGLDQNSYDELIVGRITGPWGLLGDVKVEPSTDFPQRFSPGSVLLLEGRPTHVVRSRNHKCAVVVKLDLVNDRTQAESLRGKLLAVSRDEAAPLPEGTYYHFQIVDLGVWTDGGEYLGEVKEVLSTGANDVYVVRDAGKKEVLIPALEDVILEVKLNEGRMVVRLPEGLC